MDVLTGYRPDGLLPRHLKDLTSDALGEISSSLLEVLTKLLNCIVLSGGIPKNVCPTFYGASLIVLSKKDGGLRPIAIGNTLRRLVGKACMANKIMPAFITFGKSWRVGSDDFTFPGIVEFIVRLFWFIFMIALYAKNGAEVGCSGCNYLDEFIIGLIILQSLILVNLIVIIYISSRGNIMNAHPRRHLTKALGIRFGLFIMEVGCYILGSVCVFNPNLHCKTDVVIYSLYAVAIMLWIFFLSYVILFSFYFNPFAPNVKDGYSIAKSIKVWKRRDSDNSDVEYEPMESDNETIDSYESDDVLSEHEDDSVMLSDSWKRIADILVILICSIAYKILLRLKIICCCCFCGSNDEHSGDAFTEAAELFAYFFQEELVLSDITAGLILMSLNRKPKKVAPVTNQPMNHVPKEWMTVKNANCYIKYAVGSYGWPMFMYENFFCGLCRLWPNIRCCSCFNPNETIMNDNCCMCHMAAVRQITGAQCEDFLHVTFVNHIYETPFYIVCDHETQSIVVSVRGTISMNDVLTNFSVEGGVVEIDESSEKLCAHSGMLKAAQMIKQKLMNLELLSQAFQLYPEYNLVITGHSLGAGTASILAILLRPDYPNLQCFAFSPPGCLFNESLYKLSKNIIMSIVVGDDLIISVSWQTMEKLKLELREAIEQCMLPKYRVLLYYCCKSCVNSNQVESDIQDDSSDVTISNSIRAPLLTQQVGSARVYTTGNENYVDEESKFSSLIYPPGSILHLKRVEDSVDEFDACWVDQSQFQSQVSVSFTMASDHMPNYVQSVLDKLSKSYSKIVEVFSPTCWTTQNITFIHKGLSGKVKKSNMTCSSSELINWCKINIFKMKKKSQKETVEEERFVEQSDIPSETCKNESIKKKKKHKRSRAEKLSEHGNLIDENCN
ncbi:Sn1-specific diacylglycerol lipase beta [Nymphon striatum]|nr:Sn1-specific diacylglycerol lipase beta [Nymphon striatum]